MKQLRTLSLGLILVFLILSCQKDEPQIVGPSTETTNPKIYGTVSLQNGQKAIGAWVRLRQPTFYDTLSLHAPAFATLESTLTDTLGRFKFKTKTLPTVFVLEARLQDSLGLLRSTASIDTSKSNSIALQPFGNLIGTVTRGGPWSIPGIKRDETIILLSLETGRYTITDTSGAFKLPSLPAGWHTFTAYAPDGHFLPAKPFTFEIKSGVTSKLPTLILEWSPQVDLPSVSGFRIDTLASGELRLFWSALKLSDLAGYVIYTQAESTLPIALDTVSRNTLFYTVPQLSNSTLYSIRALDSAGNLGPIPTTPVAPTPPTPPSGNQTLHGKVLMSSSLNPIAQLAPLAWVKIFTGPDTGNSFSRIDTLRLIDSVQANAQGLFSYSKCPAGKLILSSMLINYSGMAATTKENDSVTLVLQPSAQVIGRLSRGGFNVTSVSKENGFLIASSLSSGRVQFSEFSGQFALSSLPAGKHIFGFFGTPEAWFQPSYDTLNLEPGQTLNLDSVVLKLGNTKALPPPKITSVILKPKPAPCEVKWSLPAIFNMNYDSVRCDLRVSGKSILSETVIMGSGSYSCSMPLAAQKTGEIFDVVVFAYGGGTKTSLKVVTPLLRVP